MTFTLEQALKAQKALRETAALPPEQFSLEALIGMLSDEIETLRSGGANDRDIAALIAKATGAEISSGNIAANYAQPDKRRG